MTEIEPTQESLLTDDAAPTPWSEGRRRLIRASTYWLATVREDGRPHVMPLLGVWVDEALHFVASARSQKARNLARDPRCVLTASNDRADLVIEGEAAKVTDDATLHRVADAYASKYEWRVDVRDAAFWAEGAPTAGRPPYDVYRVVPDVVFAFGHDETFRPTRWRFALDEGQRRPAGAVAR